MCPDDACELDHRVARPPAVIHHRWWITAGGRATLRSGYSQKFLLLSL